MPVKTNTNTKKGFLKRNYKLMAVTSESYKEVPTEGKIILPQLLSLSEFNVGKAGYLLYSIIKDKFVFGPERFYDMDLTRKK